MLQDLGIYQQIGFAVVSVACLIQLFTSIYMAISLKAASRERHILNKEMFGLVKRIEALTSSRREQMLKHYDKILANLALRLPPTIAAQASQTIFDTESKILSRLVELEPEFKTNESARRKMDELVKSMENLEQTVVNITAESVRKVMLESRSDFIEEERSIEKSEAA
jgi:hypothetical protein